MTAKVISLNVVHDRIPDVGGSVGETAIDKRPVSSPKLVTQDGVAGDHRADMVHHGSPNQAVYAYAREDYDWWSKELALELNPGVFGENLTTIGIELTNLEIGSKIKVGSATLQATAPRIPCGTFQRWLKLDHWVKRFTEGGRPGTYFKVIEPGEVAAGNEIVVTERPEHGVTILDYFLVQSGDRDQSRVQSLVNCADLDDASREKFAKFLK